LLFAPPVEQITGPRCRLETRPNFRGFLLDEQLGLLVARVVNNRQIEPQASIYVASALFGHDCDCRQLCSFIKKKILDCGFKLVLAKFASRRDSHFDGKRSQLRSIPVAVIERTQGQTPPRTAVATDMAAVKAMTGQFIRTSARGGISIGAAVRKYRIAAKAIAIPSAPPGAASKSASVSNCRASLARPLPSAARTANSRCRPNACPSSRSLGWYPDVVSQDESSLLRRGTEGRNKAVTRGSSGLGRQACQKDFR
jgi:hypothetical protein